MTNVVGLRGVGAFVKAVVRIVRTDCQFLTMLKSRAPTFDQGQHAPEHIGVNMGELRTAENFAVLCKNWIGDA